MAQDTRIVVDLLERHSRVPSREEILERYVRTYQGRRLGVGGGEAARGPADGSPKAPAPEVPSLVEAAAAQTGDAPSVETRAMEPEFSQTPTAEMEAVAEPGVDSAEGPEAEWAEDSIPTQGMPAVHLADAAPAAEFDQEEAEENEAGDVAGSSEEEEAVALEGEGPSARPSGRPGKKKKRKKKRGLGA